MASLKRKKHLRPLPEGATIKTRRGKRTAEWRDKAGKKQAAELVEQNGELRVRIESKTWTAKYRDGEGFVREVSTGCSDRQAAQCVLNDLVKRAEKVRSNILTPAEDRIADHQAVSLEQHVSDYLAHLEAEDTSGGHQKNVLRSLNRIFGECRFKRLTDIRREKVERWLVNRSKAGASNRTRNLDRPRSWPSVTGVSHRAVR